MGPIFPAEASVVASSSAKYSIFQVHFCTSCVEEMGGRFADEHACSTGVCVDHDVSCDNTIPAHHPKSEQPRAYSSLIKKAKKIKIKIDCCYPSTGLVQITLTVGRIACYMLL